MGSVREPQQVFMSQSFVVNSPHYNNVQRYSNMEGQKSTPVHINHNTDVRHSNIELRPHHYIHQSPCDKQMVFNGNDKFALNRRDGSQNTPPAFMPNPLNQSISPPIKNHGEIGFRNSVQNIQSSRTPFVEIVNTQSALHREPNSDQQRKSNEINQNVSLSNFFDFSLNLGTPVHRQNPPTHQNAFQEYAMQQPHRHSFNRVSDVNQGQNFQKVQAEKPGFEDESPKLTSLNVSMLDVNENVKTSPPNMRFDLLPTQESGIQNESQVSRSSPMEARVDRNFSMIAVNNSNVRQAETSETKMSLLEFEKKVASESESLSNEGDCRSKGTEVQEPQTRRNFNPKTPDSRPRDKFANSIGRNTLSLSAEKPRKRNSKLHNHSMLNFNIFGKKSILKKKGILNQQEKKKVCINEDDNTKHLVDKYLHQLSSVESMESRGHPDPQIVFIPQQIQQAAVFNFPNGQPVAPGRSFTNAVANLQGRFMVVQNVEVNPQGMVYTQYVQRK